MASIEELEEARTDDKEYEVTVPFTSNGSARNLIVKYRALTTEMLEQPNYAATLAKAITGWRFEDAEIEEAPTLDFLLARDTRFVKALVKAITGDFSQR